MQRDSQQDQDKVIWQAAAIPLGAAGLDLRTPAAPGALTKLLNARFHDERTLDRRHGYIGIQLQDAADFATGTLTPDGWMYGLGQRLDGLADAHHPLPLQGKGTFRFDGTDVAWTGDRLLIVRDDGHPAVGSSTHWSRYLATTDHKYGIPAYLPVQTDSSAPDVVTGDYVETCLTDDLRVVVATATGNDLLGWVIDRSTGAVLNYSTIVDGGTTIREPRLVNSNGEVVLVYRNGTDLYLTYWTGSQWALPLRIGDGCDAHCVGKTSTGFVLIWRATGIRVAAFTGHRIDQSAITYGTVLSNVFSDAGEAIALAVAPDDSFAVVNETTTGPYRGLAAVFYDATATHDVSVVVIAQDEGVEPFDAGLTACFRGQSNSDSRYPLVIYAGQETQTTLIEVFYDGLLTTHNRQTSRYRTQVCSHAFRVGDQVFCWLRARNSETAYLVAGSSAPQVVGIADREECKERVLAAGNRALPTVQADPLDEHAFTWVRPYNPVRLFGDTRYRDLYDRAGNARIGDVQFIPQLSAVQYGEGVYLAGSLVRLWDGIELGDAGFHDYPTVSDLVQSNGAGSLSNGIYYYRAYPVRYTKRGERIQGPAITSASVTVTPGNNTVTLAINPVPCTNHDDVTIEVYRTQAGGTTFYLDGTIANDLTVATLSYVSTISDAALDDQVGDPFAPGIGQTAELQEFGPLGCELLVVAGDRLWGAGGQVPAGIVQFSKLRETNEGAGFDTLSGYQQIDIQGGRVTSIAAFGDATLFFQESGFQVVAANGPNNYGIGSFGVPQLVLADGATTHFGTVVTPIGVAYWGADGPRLVASNFQVDQICAAVRELSKDMTPTGVQVDLARQEIVWFTESGRALLWNFRAVESRFNQLTSQGRWAEWSGLKVAGASHAALITTDGRMLYEDASALGDDNVPFEHAGATGYIAPQAILGGATHVKQVGVAGEFLGPHELRLKIYYNGSPMWMDQHEWDPLENTGLQSGTELGELTAAQIDALGINDKSGQYATHKVTSKHNCRHFRVEWSDIAAFRPTYRLHELTLELGAKGGLGRVSVNKFN